jgi:hypothetical protein
VRGRGPFDRARSDQAEDPSDPLFFPIFTRTSAAVTLLAAGLVWGSLRRTLQRRAVVRIATSLGEAPAAGALEPALAQAVGDPELRIAYWLPRAQHFVDAQGHQVVEPRGTPARAITALIQDDRTVALVSHAAGRAGIESLLGPAVRLAREHERLQAEGLAQLDELRASRTRIVPAGVGHRGWPTDVFGTMNTVKAVTGMLPILPSYERRGDERAEVVARASIYLDVPAAAYL